MHSSTRFSSLQSSASTLSGAGNYVLTNVATGQTLSFSRSGVTNFVPQSGGEPVAIQVRGYLSLLCSPRCCGRVAVLSV